MFVDLRTTSDSFTVTLDNEMLTLLFRYKVVGTRILIDGYIN